MTRYPPRRLPKKKPKRSRRLLALLLGSLGALLALWVGLHEIPWLGPLLADGTRAVVGPGPVAWAEDAMYGVEDRLNRLRFRHAKPKTFWSAPAVTAAPAEPGEVAVVARAAGLAGFSPVNFAPPFDEVAAEGDGIWSSLADAADPTTGPTLYRTTVHPDSKRTYSAVALVAIDLRRLELGLIAGSQEPGSSLVPRERRPGVIPPDKVGRLVAAFNGGFKAMHGRYGMKIGLDMFLPPRDISCTIALYRDGSTRIRTWPAIAMTEADMVAYRQTPPCLVERGVANSALSMEYNRNWGATVSGETVIRRSAVGIDAAGGVLFYGLGVAVTAQSLARAMAAAGAHDAAQLDVNQAYPRFLMYTRASAGEPTRATSSLIADTKFQSDDYVGTPSVRDFFYLVLRDPSR